MNTYYILKGDENRELFEKDFFYYKVSKFFCPIYKWQIAKGICPSCGKSIFLSFRNHPHMTRCIRCKANITNLSQIPVIRRHFNSNFAKKCVWEMSTYGATCNWLKRNFYDAAISEFFPARELGSVINGIRNEDVQHLTFADCSLDLITSNQVFEHVPEYTLGLSECYRVLKTGGALIFTVPLFSELEQTEQVAKIDRNGQIEFIGKPEYHDSRLGGAFSAPVFWHFSTNDIIEKVKSAGFSKASIMEIKIVKIQGVSAKVIYAIKE